MRLTKLSASLSGPCVDVPPPVGLMEPFALQRASSQIQRAHPSGLVLLVGNVNPVP